MTFFAFGVNHLRAPLELRESFALEAGRIRKLYRRLELAAGSELILLSTCNRTEAYVFGTLDDVESVRTVLSAASGTSWPNDVDFLLQDEAAVRHVLEVAAGLKSLVLGDAQIFSQLKEAYRIAAEEQWVGTTMHRLMHTAFRTAKRVINETDLTTGAASIPYQAVEVARAHFQSRSGRAIDEVRVLIIGTGSMGRLAAEALHHSGVDSIAFTNRSERRGRETAEKYRASYVPWGSRHEAAVTRDLVVVATSADDAVIHLEEIKQLKDSKRRAGDGSRGEAETLFIDISVPRNVELGIADLEGFGVIDLDELSHDQQETEDLRRTAVPEARKIVEETLSEFVSWVFHHQALQPAIQAIADTFERIRDQEVSRHHNRFEAVDRSELDRITRSIIQKILAVPIVRLKSVDPESIDFVHGVQLLHALFRREACEDGSEPPTAQSMIEDSSQEDCPVDPPLPTGAIPNGLSEQDLRDILRQFVREDARRVE